MPPAGMDGNYEVQTTSILTKSRNKISFVPDYPIGHIQVCCFVRVVLRSSLCCTTLVCTFVYSNQ